MLDLKLFREDPDQIRSRLRIRGKAEYIAAVDSVVELDERRRALISEVDNLRARRNEVSPQVGKLKQAGRHDEAEPLVIEMRELGERMAGLETERDDVERSVRDLLLNIPNLPDERVPEGGEEANQVVREWGDERAYDFGALPHWELGEQLGILDLPRGTRMAGSGFPLYVGMGARLERALINLMLDMHVKEHGYTEVAPPFVVNEAAALGTGHLPKFADEMYFIGLDGLYLVPTAELPLTSIHASELLTHEMLPKRYVAYTPCFRREAGSHGKDTRGILRVHQFDKVELMRYERPDASVAALEELTSQAEAVLQRLGLRYRVLLLAGGDLGFSNAITYDLEVWAPGVGRWLEVSSCSLYTEFQARRANVRFRPSAGAKPEFVHTLNGSGLGLPRTLIALLETYQQEDGSIMLPESVAEYLGTHRISRTV
jgi:seryl-tRNA synthetase